MRLFFILQNWKEMCFYTFFYSTLRTQKSLMQKTLILEKTLSLMCTKYKSQSSSSDWHLHHFSEVNCSGLILQGVTVNVHFRNKLSEWGGCDRYCLAESHSWTEKIKCLLLYAPFEILSTQHMVIILIRTRWEETVNLCFALGKYWQEYAELPWKITT